jgi:1-aminocyclopropane-1-carboxylate deaminase
LISYQKTPLFELKSQILDQFGLKLIVKREDLNHPQISGNKWWKLKYNLDETLRLGKKTILTFGGAYSNHIYASAAAANELNLKSIGVIRGEETLPFNPTLSFAKRNGMELVYVSREEYRRKTDPDFLDQLAKRFGDFYLIPEGGTNDFAVKGCAEFSEKLIEEIEFDYVCVPVGTGGTIAGIINGLSGKKKVLGFSSLKDGAFLEQEIRKYTRHENWQLIQEYHFGGYAKTTRGLTAFMKEMETNHHLALDQVYTAKMLFGIFDLIKKNYFQQESTVLVVHTGGMQGTRKV